MAGVHQDTPEVLQTNEEGRIQPLLHPQHRESTVGIRRHDLRGFVAVKLQQIELDLIQHFGRSLPAK